MMFAERKKKNIYMRLCVAHNNKVLDKEEKYKGLDDGYIGRPRKQEIMKFFDMLSKNVRPGENRNCPWVMCRPNVFLLLEDLVQNLLNFHRVFVFLSPESVLTTGQM